MVGTVLGNFGPVDCGAGHFGPVDFGAGNFGPADGVDGRDLFELDCFLLMLPPP